VGCASGTNLLEISQGFAEAGIACELYGSEYEDALVNKAQSRGIRVVQGDVSGLVALDVRFDLIVMSHVFEHMTDLNGILALISKLLKPSGLLFIEVPGIMNLPDYQYDMIDSFVNAHTYSFNLETLRAILSYNGFVCLKGNEIVQGMFRFDPSVAVQAVSNGCSRRIVEYIQELESTRLAHKQKFLKKLLWPLFKAYYYLEYFFIPKQKFCLR
jgi:predicted TPR repeat methyltransferase